MRLSLSLLTLLLLLAASPTVTKSEEEEKAKGEDGGNEDEPKYAEALKTVAEEMQKAQAKADETAEEHMKNVEKDPGSLIIKEAMKEIMTGNTFLPQKAGTRSILLEGSQGFNGITNYEPSSWKISESMSGPTEKKEEEKGEEEEETFEYPMGLGPVLYNQCTERNYTRSSPCYNSKLFDLEEVDCADMIDSAAYVGVGFDGRGFYNSESRKISLVQRICANKAKFMDKDVPDIMNVFGIYDTSAETKSFQSVDQYMSYITKKAGLSNQKGLFTSEASKYSKAKSFGVNLGGIGAIAGGIIGGVVGGPAGAALGASVGGAIGGTIGGGSGTGSGSSSATDKGKSSSKVEQTASSDSQQTSTQNFFAIMYVNIILYEISLDEVKPTDLSLAVLKDYMDLPASYFSVGADVKYQNFLLRYGTHFIRSGKFGGQLKVTKTCKTSQALTSQQFARVAESEFQSMFATLQSKYSQKSQSFGLLGFSSKSKSAKQTAEAKTETNYKSTSDEQNQQNQAAKQSEFTQTNVEAQGGSPEIAEALMDFYTPAFKQLFHDWVVSIKDYPKPFEFQLKAIHDIFNMNMKDLFPAGNKDFGCGGGNKVMVEAKTNKRFYIDTVVKYIKKKTVEEKIRVYCKFNSLEDFEQSLHRRRMSLEKAVGVYMVEGPFPTSSFNLPAGETGCEETTLASLKSFQQSNDTIKYSELKSQAFILAFDMPQPLLGIASTHAKFKMALRGETWFAIDPKSEMIHLYDGCQAADPKGKKVCFRNIILTYDESEGFFGVDPKDFASAKQRIPSLPNWLSGTTVARPKRLHGAADVRRQVQADEVAIPCNVKWLNSHRLDPSRKENCIHFTAASQGDIFVVFASIPKNHHTWYYLQISPSGAAFYQGMKLQKRDIVEGMGILGDRNLFQSFFVCVSQNKGAVTMQYGKADPDSDVGTVYSGYRFPPRAKFSRLSFYSFGSGEKSVSLMDIRLTKQLPSVECLNDQYEKVDGHCILKCHEECDGCKRAQDSKACHQCKNMRVDSVVAGKSIIECVSLCPASYQPSTKSKGLCEPCPPGYFKSAVGNSKCSPCHPGTISSGGVKECAPCNFGTFNSQKGQTVCQKCPAGTFAGVTRARLCDPCPVGHFSGLGQKECSPCQLGHFSSKKGSQKCSPCPAGSFGSSRGMTSCSKCPSGTSSVAGSRSCSNSCPKGQFSPKKGVPCRSCKPGTFSESAGATSCSSCRPGTFQAREGRSSCEAAPKGAFVNGIGATKFVKCSAGTFNDKTGQTSSSACQACPVGHYSHIGGQAACKKCPLGQFQASRGKSQCQKASPGHYVDTEGLGLQKRCSPGHFASSSGSSACTKCPKGHFANGLGSTKCTRCPVGHYAPNEGFAVCSPCPTGRAQSSEGAASCVACQPGEFAGSKGNSRCSRCPAGRYASSSGTATCSVCKPGSYSSSGARKCERCPPGRFATSSGSSSCTTCYAGTYADAYSTVVCKRCSPGYFAASRGSTRCSPCSAGHYASGSGSAKCTKCGHGTYAPSTGSRACLKCGTTLNEECNAFLATPFVGCFKDTSDRDLPIVVVTNKASKDYCSLLCRKKKTAFFGMQNGNACMCGNSYGKHERVSDSECNKQCQGNSKQKCGATRRNSVYRTGLKDSLASKYIGCYRDKSSRDLPKKMTSGNGYPMLCHRKCLAEGYMVFGVQAGGECYCGDRYGKYGKVGDSECSRSCSGDKTQKCGGMWINSVYKTGLAATLKSKYVGCKSPLIHYWKMYSYRKHHISIAACYRLCKNMAKPYFGMNDNGWCVCLPAIVRIGDEMYNYSNNCPIKCREDSSLSCGGGAGGTGYSVYKI